MLGRVPIRLVRSLDEAAAVVASHDRKTIVIFDVDNTLARQGAPFDEVAAVVDGTIGSFEAIPSVSRVIVLTNGPQRGVPQMVSRGNKPWTTRHRLGLHRAGDTIVVVGDQVLTDGLLAWRLNATFLHLVIDETNEDRSQARMRSIGRVAQGLFFREFGDGDADGA